MDHTYDSRLELKQMIKSKPACNLPQLESLNEIDEIKFCNIRSKVHAAIGLVNVYKGT